VKQWNAFCNKNKSRVEQTELKDIVADLAAFLVPVINLVKQGTEFHQEIPSHCRVNPGTVKLIAHEDKFVNCGRIRSYKCRGVAQPGSAPALGAGFSNPTTPFPTLVSLWLQ
jgi:hypothetical protein